MHVDLLLTYRGNETRAGVTKCVFMKLLCHRSASDAIAEDHALSAMSSQQGLSKAPFSEVPYLLDLFVQLYEQALTPLCPHDPLPPVSLCHR